MPKYAFFEVQVRPDDPTSRIEFELFDELVPRTVLNFLSFCRGVNVDGIFRTYAKTPFHRIYRNCLVQGGDVVYRDGKGRESIYGYRFEDEDLTQTFAHPFMLAMANQTDPNTNSCQFLITCHPLPQLDHKHVILGKVVFGFDAIIAISRIPIIGDDVPVHPATIVSCGVDPTRTIANNVPFILAQPFLAACRLIDPAIDIDSATQLFKYCNKSQRELILHAMDVKTVANSIAYNKKIVKKIRKVSTIIENGLPELAEDRRWSAFRNRMDFLRTLLNQ